MARANQSARLVFFVTLLSLAPLGVAQSYLVTDLGAASGGGRAINAQGDVLADNGLLAFFWTPTHGVFNLQALSGGDTTVAGGINAKGLISGQSTVDSFGTDHAALWIDGEVQDLGTLPGGVISWATSVNAAGDVAGASDGSGFQPHAMVWTKTLGMQNLDTFPGGSYSVAFGINRLDEVVGYSDVASGLSYAFIWSKTAGMHELASLPGGGGSSGNAINDHGQVAGGSGCGGGCIHAVLWNQKPGSILDLGLLPDSSFSSAYGLNNKIQVVGSADFASSPHAFVWSSLADMQDLNNLIPANSGWLLVYAFAINDNGQITGQGTINGETHAFLLTPVAGVSKSQNGS
jgi:probable HAF family extracellular repeat protein